MSPELLSLLGFNLVTRGLNPKTRIVGQFSSELLSATAAAACGQVDVCDFGRI